MTPRKLNVMFAFFCYTGNSSGTSVVWDVASWWAKTLLAIKTEDKYKERIDSVLEWPKADTPITMTRNESIKVAKAGQADILIMVDSDMKPDVHFRQEGHADATPFFGTAFDAIYDHWDRGPLVIGAPYGGSPPHENMFVFTWSAKMNGGDESPFELRQYNREEVQQLAGLHECAALPTGLIAYDMRAFDLIDPPYFSYEWADETQSEKSSTEDVQNTRDISINGITKLGYNPVMCAWSSWAGHYKVWCVGKPWKFSAEDVAENLANAVRRGNHKDERIMDFAYQWRDRITPEMAAIAKGNGESCPKRI